MNNFSYELITILEGNWYIFVTGKCSIIPKRLENIILNILDIRDDI